MNESVQLLCKPRFVEVFCFDEPYQRDDLVGSVCHHAEEQRNLFIDVCEELKSDLPSSVGLTPLVQYGLCCADQRLPVKTAPAKWLGDALEPVFGTAEVSNRTRCRRVVLQLLHTRCESVLEDIAVSHHIHDRLLVPDDLPSDCIQDWVCSPCARA